MGNYEPRGELTQYLVLTDSQFVYVLSLYFTASNVIVMRNTFSY